MAISRHGAVVFQIVARIELHDLRSPKRAKQLAALLHELHEQGVRVVVWVADEGRRQILDDYLWTYEKLSFVPHVLWSPALGDVEDPIVLVGDEVNPNKASTLVVGDELPGGPWAATFKIVHDLVGADEEGAARRAFWDRWRRDSEDISTGDS
ncbi:MAG: DNA polymerase III subunit chi [Acidobacteriota bacterium]|nr:DNA polymerase III subunit chi [Acidobacteriota bacterium]